MRLKVEEKKKKKKIDLNRGWIASSIERSTGHSRVLPGALNSQIGSREFSLRNEHFNRVEHLFGRYNRVCSSLLRPKDT